MNLKALVESKKCRHGQAAGTTKNGAFWLACDPIELRRCGGDGIGNSGADVTFRLSLRHFRSGLVQAMIHRDAWHQNGSYSGGGDTWESCPSVLDCATVEEVVVALKAMSSACRTANGTWREAVYSDRNEERVTQSLTALGLQLAAPAPDEVV